MKTKQLVFTGIFTTLVFLTTIIFKIPISIGWGYVHFGDLTVMLAGMLLGPVFGGLAAAFGSLLADIAAGAVVYAIPTFILKGLLAFAVGSLYKNFKGDDRTMKEKIRISLHLVLGVLIVVGGYFLTDIILAKFAFVDKEGSTLMAFAAFGLLPNLIQVSFGVISSLIFYLPLKGPFEKIYKRS